MSKMVTTRKHSRSEKRAGWNRQTDPDHENIDYSDARKLDHQFFANAVVVQPGTLLAALGSSRKRQITLRIDEDVVDFFKKHGKGYQRLMNFALRAYMLRQKSAGQQAKPIPAKQKKHA
jgi:uncharacterized protein (DUF4415 family)